jgi:hypothetical protein
MAELALSVAEDPTKLPGVLENMGKEFVAWDKWSGDHPGRAAGEAAFNIGSLFVPGGALSKTGSVAKGLNMTRRMLDEGRLPRLGELGEWSRGAPKLDGLGDLPGQHGLPEVPEFKPAAIPDSVIGPPSPHGIDAPPTPRGLEGPAGPPDPPGPTSTPGGTHQAAEPGGGPPPEPPGRSVAPPDTTPGPVDSPHVSDSAAPSHTPSAGEQAPPPAASHAPESSSPPATHEPSQSPAEHTPVEHTPAEQTPAEHAPAEHAPASQAPAEHVPAEHAPASQAPAEGHRPDAVVHNGTPEGATHTPTTTSADHRPAVDGGQTHQPTPGDAPRHDNGGATQTPMAGMPVAPHVAGGGPSLGDGHAASSRTPTPESPMRSPDAKAPQSNSAEAPRVPANAAGPGAGSSPSAPVKPATSHVPEGVAEPLRGPEPPSDGTTHEMVDREPHGTDGVTHDHEPGSPWDSPIGRDAARLLPADDSGYRIQPRDCEFLGISPEQVEHWANREAPLGMTPSEFKEFSNSLYDALAREGFSANDLDMRLQGSSARFFSGEHKALELDSDDPAVQARIETWFGDDENRPLRRPFDSMHQLGLDSEPSDYDVQISSDSMVDACRRQWDADGSHGDLVNRKYGFIDKRLFKNMFPTLWEWAAQWERRTGRPVVPALFASSGPPDTTPTGVSSHFRESDWRLYPEGSDSH